MLADYYSFHLESDFVCSNYYKVRTDFSYRSHILLLHALNLLNRLLGSLKRLLGL